ncbi:hypothetical protein SAMN05216331_10533 [Porphyromonadaceae bacterium KH3R12]|uniref:hypothetical protein n=1 Tax=Proteiniphilum saccharofermentans TaxID=1642647 RepID=UPI000898CA63|nr:hypothetical protein [Proteiniphilum saccharofermentans]SDZ81543.1 hypothetical protein SAMN05216331_10533 [Porphyromonadaceae bacterium KH3R12]
MKTVKIDILNPRAEELLRNLADLQLINISESEENVINFSPEQKEMLIMSEKDVAYGNIFSEEELEEIDKAWLY